MKKENNNIIEEIELEAMSPSTLEEYEEIEKLRKKYSNPIREIDEDGNECYIDVDWA